MTKRLWESKPIDGWLIDLELKYFKKRLSSALCCWTGKREFEFISYFLCIIFIKFHLKDLKENLFHLFYDCLLENQTLKVIPITENVNILLKNNLRNRREAKWLNCNYFSSFFLDRRMAYWKPIVTKGCRYSWASLDRFGERAWFEAEPRMNFQSEK